MKKTAMPPGLLARLIVLATFGPAILMFAAGDLSWTMGWAFSGLAFAYSLLARLLLFAKNPDLIAERADSMKKDNIEPWDRKMVPVIGVLLPTLMVLIAGLDHRFHWSAGFPLWVRLAGCLALVLGGLFSFWAAAENSFFSAVVRIQEDRGQTVVTTGPYRYVRHPGYAGGIVFYLAIPFMLGSLWALVPILANAALTVLRTALEDRTLHLKLKGYPEFAARTRWRLIPGIW